MAAGGWIYAGMESFKLVATANQTAINPQYSALVDRIATLAGWTITTPYTVYYNLSATQWAAHAVLTHTTGSRLITWFWGEAFSGSTVIIAGSNYDAGTNLIASAIGAGCMGFGYIPPGFTPTGADPSVVGYIPVGGFPIIKTSPFTARTTAAHNVHVIGKGETVVLLLEMFTQAGVRSIDKLWMGGTLFSTLSHASDTGADAQRGLFYGATDIAGTERKLICKKADGTVVVGDRSANTVETFALRAHMVYPSVYAEPEKEAWSPILCGFAAATHAIVANNGMKGLFDTDLLRVTTPCQQKELLDSETLITIGPGFGAASLAVGWDSSNGGML